MRGGRGKERGKGGVSEEKGRGKERGKGGVSEEKGRMVWYKMNSR